MLPNQKTVSLYTMILSVLILVNAVILKHAFTINGGWYRALIFTLPLFTGAAIYQ